MKKLLKRKGFIITVSVVALLLIMLLLSCFNKAYWKRDAKIFVMLQHSKTTSDTDMVVIAHSIDDSDESIYLQTVYLNSSESIAMLKRFINNAAAEDMTGIETPPVRGPGIFIGDQYIGNTDFFEFTHPITRRIIKFHFTKTDTKEFLDYIEAFAAEQNKSTSG